ncbi:MAG: AsmA-like C-terminal domain-containing protein [Bauldia sp.]
MTPGQDNPLQRGLETPSRAGLLGGLIHPRVLRTLARLGLVVGLVVLVAVGAAVALIMRGPTELAVLRDRVEQTLQDSLGSRYTVDVGKTALDIDPVLGLVVLVDDVAISTRDGEVVASIPSTRLAVDPLALLMLHVTLRSVELNQPVLAFARDAGGGVMLGRSATGVGEGDKADEPGADSPRNAGAPEPAGGFPDIFNALQILDRGLEPTVAKALQAGFERFSMVQATVEIADNLTAGGTRVFSRADLQAVLDRGTNGASVTLTAPGYAGRWTAKTELRAEPGTGERLLAAEFSQLSLADIFPRVGLDDSPIASDIPFFGRASVRFSPTGEIADASMQLDLGAGNVVFRGEQESILLDEASLKLRWDVANKAILIDPSRYAAGKSRGTLTGVVRPLGGPADRRFAFEIKADDAILAPRDVAAPPLSAQLLTVNGVADLPRKRINFDKAELVAGNNTLTATGWMGFEGKTPSVNLAAQFSPMPAAVVKQIWPPFIAGPARKWVVEHVSGGRIAAGDFKAAIPGGLLWNSERPVIPEDNLKLKLRLEDVTFTTIGDVPPITRASGNAAIAGSTFGLDIDHGEIRMPSGKTVTINAGAFAVANTAPLNPGANLELALAGDAGAMAELSNVKPFSALDKQSIDPKAIAGSATAGISAKWQMRPQVTEADIEWRVNAAIDNFASAAPISGHAIREGKMNLSASPAEVSINGRAKIDGVTANLAMTVPLGENAKAASDGRRQIRMVLDDDARKKLGIGLDDVIAGTVEATVNELPNKGQHFDLDLKRARLTLRAVGWSKGIGVPGRLVFDLVPSTDGFRVENLALSGTGFGMTGRAVLDKKYALVSADIDQLNLHKGDQLGFTIRKGAKSGYAIVAKGKSFDVRGVLDLLRETPEPGPGAPDVTVEASVDRLVGHNGASIDRGSLTLSATAGQVKRVQLTGVLGASKLALTFSDSTQNTSLNLETGDAGAFFRFVDFYSRIQGGSLRLAGTRSGVDRPMVGSFDVVNFSVVGEPAMARVAAVDTSRPDYYNGNFDPNRVQFDRMVINFTKRDSMLVIEDALLRGNAVGAVFDGRIDLASHSLALAGTYLPAYAFNNLFSKLPIIGLALAGGPQEGLLGVTFKVEGQMDQPQLTINALSAIAPGVFRKIFEFRGPGGVGPQTFGNPGFGTGQGGFGNAQPGFPP